MKSLTIQIISLYSLFILMHWKSIYDFKRLIIYMNQLAEISPSANKYRIVCKVANPINKLICFYSFDKGNSWVSQVMIPTNEFEYLMYISDIPSFSSIYLFFQIETLDSNIIIDSNNGIFYQLLSQDDDFTPSIQTDSNNISEFQDLNDDYGSIEDNKPDLENLHESFPSYNAPSPISSSFLSSPSIVQSEFPENLQPSKESSSSSLAIRSYNPFNSSSLSKPLPSQKIIKFRQSHISDISITSKSKSKSRDMKSKIEFFTCQKCNGRFPEPLSICPYCGSQNN